MVLNSYCGYIEGKRIIFYDCCLCRKGLPEEELLLIDDEINLWKKTSQLHFSICLTCINKLNDMWKSREIIYKN